MTTKPSMGKQRLRMNGNEYDTFTIWRRWYCYLQNHSGAAKVKRSYRRRERRVAKRNLRKEVGNA